MANLAKGEEQSEVAVDAVLRFQHFGCLDALPAAGEFNEYSLFADARLLVQVYELESLGYRPVLVKG